MSHDHRDSRHQSSHAGRPSSRSVHDIDFEAEHDPEAARRWSNMKLMRASQELAAERGGSDAAKAPPGAAARVDRAANESGAPLPDEVRGRFESSLGADLSGVRVHTGSASAAAAESMGAKAYTTGQDIHFGGGQYDPSSKEGQRLLAHEVAHTVQQGNASAAPPQAKLVVSSPADAHEQEADRAADAMLVGAPTSASPAVTAGTLQRKEGDPSASRHDGASGNPFEQKPQNSRQQSRAFDRVFAFDPPNVMLDSTEPQHVRITNVTDEPQAIDEHELVGDASAFEVTLRQRSVQLAPGESLWFQVRCTQTDDQPRAAALVVRSTFNQREPARLMLSGVKRVPTGEGAQPATGVAISATTPEGRPNSINSALLAVGAAWNAVLGQQQAGVNEVKSKAQKEMPRTPAWWEKTFDSVLAEGLQRVVGYVMNHYTGGLAYAVWNYLQRLRFDAIALAAEKEVTALTGKVHKAVTSSLLQGVATDQIAAQRGALLKDNVLPATLRDAFFEAQSRVLAQAYIDNVTTLTNHEGDFVAMEAQHPGLGFAALEGYRKHLMTHTARVFEIQRNQTLGAWAAFLAQLELGTHVAEPWENARDGAALEKNLYGATDSKHRLRDVARGVLEIGVVWSYDRRRTQPIAEIRHARVQGLQPELKEMLKKAPIRDYNIPLIVQGKVIVDSYAAQGDREKTSHLRISRNEGGAIAIGAEAKTKSAEMLDDLGNGDAYEGARALLEHVEALRLESVE